jgi:hypothetical protein
MLKEEPIAAPDGEKINDTIKPIDREKVIIWLYK